MSDKSGSLDRELGVCPDTQRKVLLKNGRFGPYVQREKREGSKIRPRNAALLKDMDPASLTLDTALKLLSLPRNLGQHPILNQDIEANNGRYGPYLRCGNETRKLPPDISPIDVSFEQALLLFSQPKKSRKRTERKKPVKVLGESPTTGEAVSIFVGKFGLFITDGVTNVSVPKEYSAEEVTLDHALQLLEHKKNSR